MRDNIAELTELMEAYRRRSKSVPFRTVAQAYADAAGDLEDILAARRAADQAPAQFRISS